MKELNDVLDLSYSSREIEKLLLASNSNKSAAPYLMGFSENEDFFIDLENEIEISSFSIHHEVTNPFPEPEYSENMTLTLERIILALPQAFVGLNYFFDPSDILKPSFFCTIADGNSFYLYLLKIDLLMRPSGIKILKPGTNDKTAKYSTKRIFIESELIPVQKSEKDNIFILQKYISDTWIDEKGKNYQVKGIWLDHDLTKFFSKMFLPGNRKTYPFYPLVCKYKTLCCFVPVPEKKARQSMLPFYSAAIEFFSPVMENIMAAIKKETCFSESIPEFISLKKMVPERWLHFFDGVTTNSFINEWNMKEYKLEFYQK